LRADHGSTGVLQRFQDGPGMSWVRRMIGSNPAAATILIEQRRQMLESDMRVTLQRASSLLGDAAFPVRLAEDAGRRWWHPTWAGATISLVSRG
jgi:hypothetical protein